MPHIFVEVGPMDSKASGIATSQATSIMTAAATAAFTSLKTVTLDPKAKVKKRYLFGATLVEIAVKGGNTFAKLNGYLAVLPDRNLMKGAALFANSGVGQTGNDTEEAIKQSMSDMIAKANSSLFAK